MNCGNGAFQGSCRWLLILPGAFPGSAPVRGPSAPARVTGGAACAPQPRPGPEMKAPSVTFPHEDPSIQTSPADDDRPRSIPRPQAAPAAVDPQRCSPDIPGRRLQRYTRTATDTVPVVTPAMRRHVRTPVLRPGQLQIMEAGEASPWCGLDDAMVASMHAPQARAPTIYLSLPARPANSPSDQRPSRLSVTPALRGELGRGPVGLRARLRTGQSRWHARLRLPGRR